MNSGSTTPTRPIPSTHHTPPVPGGAMPPMLGLYLVRGLAALGWAAAFAGAHDALGAGATTLLIAYPMIDAVASIVDSRRLRDSPAGQLQLFNAALSTLAAIAVGAAAASGVPAVLRVFGAWAVVSGAVQVFLAVRRRGPQTGRQWPMLIAGGLSFLAGFFYNVQAAGDDPSLDAFVTYAAAGGAFFVVQAGLLALRRRRQRAAQHA